VGAKGGVDPECGESVCVRIFAEGGALASRGSERFDSRWDGDLCLRV
jgi:hypothetical protein